MGKVVKISTPDGEALVDTDTKVMRISTPDGGMIIRRADSQAQSLPEDSKHFDNLAEFVDEGRRGAIAQDLVSLIQTDITSMSDREKDVAQALTQLGLRVEEKSSATVAGQSVVRSPLLLEAVLMFQANAIAELLPASGPVKATHFGDATPETDKLTDDFEDDMNQWFTTVAKEYYPDTSRMLFDDVGLVGSGFKKIYHCPMRKRPVSERVAGEDYIVAAGTTHIATATRATHRLRMSQNDMRKLQRSGHFLDVALGTPTEQSGDVKEIKASLLGTAALTTMPEGYRHEVYECYCELDLSEYEGFQGDEDEGQGIARPYRVSIDKNSMQLLELRRDWNEDDDLYERRRTFVKFPFVEAIGFYCIGFMHILGNTTEAMTAAWRLMIDAGMFSSFPGFLYAKDRNKQQESMVVRVAAGTGAGIQTGGAPIGDVVMSLPYKPPDPAFVQLIKMFEDDGRRVGQTSMTPVSEGKQDAPVGTTLALLDQATKVMAAVFKGLHAAQSEEFQLIKERFKEDPESFWRGLKRPVRDWKQEDFEKALEDNDIVPTADPNTPSHMHRVMRAVALVQMAQAFPELVKKDEVVKAVLKVLGWDADVFMVPPPDPNAPTPTPPPLPVDPVGMAAVDAKKAGDAAKTEVEKLKLQAGASEKQAEIASNEKIAAEKLASDGKRDNADDILARMELFLNHHASMMKTGGGNTGGGTPPQRPL